MARSTYNCARIRIMLSFILIPILTLLVQHCKSLNAVPVKVIGKKRKDIYDDHHVIDLKKQTFKDWSVWTFHTKHQWKCREADIILFIYSHSRIVIPLFGGRIKTLQHEDTSQHEEKTNSREQTSVIVWLMTKWRLHREVEETNIWPLH